MRAAEALKNDMIEAIEAESDVNIVDKEGKTVLFNNMSL